MCSKLGVIDNLRGHLFVGDCSGGFRLEGACGVMVIVVGNGHGDTSSNPGHD